MNLLKKFLESIGEFFTAPGPLRQSLTGRDMNRTSAELEILRKLGRAHFTRRLTQATRRARFLSLSVEQRELALERGWI